MIVPLFTRSGEVVASTLVDDDDRHLVDGVAWRLHRNTGYVRRSVGAHGTSLLHREICGLTHGDGLMVDHVNGDRLDNRRSNLRVCTNAENQQNRHSVCGRSRHRGVSWHSRDRLWVAHATFNGRTVTVGRFADEDQAGAAAAAYRAKHMPFSAEFVDERETQEV